MEKAQVVFDLETLATSFDAAIVSIGAVKFAPLKGTILDEFYINLDPIESKRLGFKIDPETIKWWQGQSKEARQAWQVNPQPVEQALSAFLEWYGPTSRPTWAKGGMRFDFPIMEYALKKIGKSPTWKYWDCLDYRTLLYVTKIDDRKLKTAGTTYHNALDDCKEQLKVLIPILQGFEEFEPF